MPVHDDETFTKLDLTDTVLADTEYNECHFLGASFYGAIFKNCAFMECTFESCNFSLVDVTDSHFSNNTFKESKVIGVNWTDIHKADLIYPPAHFEDTLLDQSIFVALDLENVRMVNCSAREVNFSAANLKGADCCNTDFENSIFNNTDLSRADFSRARNYAIDVTANKIKKAKFSLPEALNLLAGLDIIIA